MLRTNLRAIITNIELNFAHAFIDLRLAQKLIREFFVEQNATLN